MLDRNLPCLLLLLLLSAHFRENLKWFTISILIVSWLWGLLGSLNTQIVSPVFSFVVVAEFLREPELCQKSPDGRQNANSCDGLRVFQHHMAGGELCE